MTEPDAARVFFERMMNNLHASARERGRSGYWAQSVESCMAMRALCIETDPDFVLDVGTAAGASCLALYYTLHTMGGDKERRFLTVGKSLKRWQKEGIRYNAELATEYGIDMRTIPALAMDFRDVRPCDYFVDDETVFLFYDIHDPRNDADLPSTNLIYYWIPYIGRGTIAIHDIYSVLHAPKPLTKARHWKAGVLCGRDEIKPLVTYLNDCRGELIEIPATGIAYFRIEDGKPR